MELADFATVLPGYPVRKAVEHNPEGSVRIVQVSDVTEDRRIDWTGVALTELAGRRSPDWLRDGDLLVRAKGPSNYAVEVTDVPGRAVCVPTFFQVSLDRQQVLPGFMAAYINYGPGRDYLASVAEGAPVRNVRKKVLAAMPVQLPPLAEQSRIVELTEALAEERDLLQRMLANRENTLSAALREVTR